MIDDLREIHRGQYLLGRPGIPMLVGAILDLAACLDEAEKRIKELELASPCPMLKSICEDWQYTGMDKPSPDKQEMVERYLEKTMERVWEMTDEKEVTDQVRQILSDFYEVVKHGA